jgi:hypothetical protein
VKVLSATIAASFVLTGAASAKANPDALRTYHHADGFIKAIGKNAHRTQYSSNPRVRHKWQARLAYLVRVRHRAYLLLHPPRPHPVLGHLQMWLCIHSGEGAWDANTGNGYLGGLQMTPGWGGVGRPDLLSPADQIALAEREYRASGYSLNWLRHQWPNSSLACA